MSLLLFIPSVSLLLFIPSVSLLLFSPSVECEGESCCLTAASSGRLQDCRVITLIGFEGERATTNNWLWEFLITICTVTLVTVFPAMFRITPWVVCKMQVIKFLTWFLEHIFLFNLIEWNWIDKIFFLSELQQRRKGEDAVRRLCLSLAKCESHFSNLKTKPSVQLELQCGNHYVFRKGRRSQKWSHQQRAITRNISILDFSYTLFLSFHIWVRLFKGPIWCELMSDCHKMLNNHKLEDFDMVKTIGTGEFCFVTFYRDKNHNFGHQPDCGED